jgi:hypothetical protein
MELLSADRIAQLNGDQLDSLLERIRVAESQMKAAQMRVLREVDRRQIPLGDGMRTLEDWIVRSARRHPDDGPKLATFAGTDSADLDDLLAVGVTMVQGTSAAVGAMGRDHGRESDPVARQPGDVDPEGC